MTFFLLGCIAVFIFQAIVSDILFVVFPRKQTRFDLISRYFSLFLVLGLFLTLAFGEPRYLFVPLREGMERVWGQGSVFCSAFVGQCKLFPDLAFSDKVFVFLFSTLHDLDTLFKVALQLNPSIQTIGLFLILLALGFQLIIFRLFSLHSLLETMVFSFLAVAVFSIFIAVGGFGTSLLFGLLGVVCSQILYWFLRQRFGFQ